nr:MAG TPA: hypothetical protein [Caudoviricetes sp.]
MPQNATTCLIKMWYNGIIEITSRAGFPPSRFFLF